MRSWSQALPSAHTCRGVVMGRLRSEQRQREVMVMSFVFRKLGLNIAGAIANPGYLEGGDYFPVRVGDVGSALGHRHWVTGTGSGFNEQVYQNCC